MKEVYPHKYGRKPCESFKKLHLLRNKKDFDNVLSSYYPYELDREIICTFEDPPKEYPCLFRIYGWHILYFYNVVPLLEEIGMRKEE